MTRSLRLAVGSARSPRGVCRAEIGGVEALVARPGVLKAQGTIVFANAATPRGIEQPAVERLLHGLAAAGFVAVAPELPRVRDAVITPATVDALVSVASASAPRVALLGASTGAGLAILAAADPRLAPRVTAVGAVAPFASLREMLRLGTTGVYRGRPFAAAPFVGLMAERSLRAAAPADTAVELLLANRDPRRFDTLYEALAPSTRTLVDELSPSHAITHLSAPVEIAASTADTYCPAAEAEALAAACVYQTQSRVRLTVTPALLHVCPLPCLRIVDVLRFLERTLAAAAVREPARRLRPALA